MSIITRERERERELLVQDDERTDRKMTAKVPEPMRRWKRKRPPQSSVCPSTSRVTSSILPTTLKVTVETRNGKSGAN